MAQAFQMVRRAGLIEAVGMGDQSVQVPWDLMMKEVVRIHFCRGTTYGSFARFCSLASTGRLNLRPIISNQFPLEDWKKGFESAESRESVKTLLIPS